MNLKIVKNLKFTRNCVTRTVSHYAFILRTFFRINLFHNFGLGIITIIIIKRLVISLDSFPRAIKNLTSAHEP